MLDLRHAVHDPARVSGPDSLHLSLDLSRSPSLGDMGAHPGDALGAGLAAAAPASEERRRAEPEKAAEPVTGRDRDRDRGARGGPGVNARTKT